MSEWPPHSIMRVVVLKCQQLKFLKCLVGNIQNSWSQICSQTTFLELSPIPHSPERPRVCSPPGSTGSLQGPSSTSLKHSPPRCGLLRSFSRWFLIRPPARFVLWLAEHPGKGAEWGAGTWPCHQLGKLINPLVSVSSLVKSGSDRHHGFPHRTPHCPLGLPSLDLQGGAWESVWGTLPLMIWGASGLENL